MKPLFTPPRNNIHVTCSAYSKQQVERKLHWNDEPYDSLLRLSNYKATKRYWKVIDTLPVNQRIPEALIKIGFVLREIHSRERAVYIDISKKSNLATPTAQAPSETIAELNRFLYQRGVEEDLLSQEEKIIIDEILFASNLNISPSDVPDDIPKDINRNYQSIDFDSNPHNRRDFVDSVLDGGLENGTHTESRPNREKDLDRVLHYENSHFRSDIIKNAELHRGSR